MNIDDKKRMKPRVGASSCLLGNEVRYDGTHKYCPHIADILAEQFALIAFCPEVAIGLGVPRAPIQLVSLDDEIHLRAVDEPHKDVTAEMQAYAKSVLPKLKSLSGYIFKARSPSCGIADVPIYRGDASVTANKTSGLFAQAVQAFFPDLPLINEENLLDEEIRSDFISQVMSYHQARQV